MSIFKIKMCHLMLYFNVFCGFLGHHLHLHCWSCRSASGEGNLRDAEAWLPELYPSSTP